jgi:hypothetical protein
MFLAVGLAGMVVAAAVSPAVGDVLAPPRVTTPRISADVHRSGDEAPVYTRLDDGSLEYTDGAGRFTAIIAPDGSVTFLSALSVQPNITRPTSPSDRSGGLIEALTRPPGERDRPDLVPDMPLPGDTSRRAYAAIELGPHRSGAGYPAASVLTPAKGGGNFGPPPKHTAAKRAFLALTEAMRMKMRAEHHRRTVEAERRRLVQAVRQIWRDDVRSPRARRRAMFEYWDAIGSEVAVNDASQRREAASAQASVEREIRSLLPATSSHAFSADELRRFNRRRGSTRRFDPYPTPPRR